MLPDLDKMLEYKNDRITARYQRDYPHSALTPENALRELMKYIWLFFKHQADKRTNPRVELNFDCVIHREMSDIDNMWHTFLLFTQDYHQFCQDYLDGVFFHHDPLTDVDGITDKKEYGERLANYLSYIYDHLGAATLRTWFGV